MQRKPYPLFLLAPAILVSVALFWLALCDRPDPIWLEAGQMVQCRYRMLDEAVDSIQLLYNEFHPGENPAARSDSAAFRLISQPYLPTIEWSKFNEFCRTVERKRFIVLSGVTSTGATNLAVCAARLLAGRPDRLLQISCAPQFDLEYHKKYIGQEEGNRFVPGELLRFWDTCRTQPEQKYVVVLDNFDKINPETFFGPELWEMMSSRREPAQIGGLLVQVPDNFYLISVTHFGPGGQIELSEEHFKRIGRPFVLSPNPHELLEYLRRQATTLSATAIKDSTAARQLALLQDTAQQHRFLYYFLKSNALIRKNYSPGHQLGQGSNLRRCYLTGGIPALKQIFQDHINALRPERPLTKDDFGPLDYTVATNGLEEHSSFLARQVQLLRDTGYFQEVTMVAATAILTALFGWWVFRRRERLIRNYGDRVQRIFADFDQQLSTAEEASERLEQIKREVDDLVLRRRLNYTEALYFMAFIEDKVKRIDFARSVSENFRELFNAFMDDNVLTENEYLKLCQFLESIRHKIPEQAYEQFNRKVEEAYKAYHAHSGL
ncbi:MAG: hypothetical protein ABIQ93_11330 [Saprospiraceae bacterium]